MRIAVLGCGPAGLLAAHAINEHDEETDIFSVKEKSLISGAQYVHRSIPGVTAEEPDGLLTFSKSGSKEGYALKVYSDRDADCSFDEYEAGEVPAWSMQAMYDELWNRYESWITDRTISLSDFAELEDEYDLVISSIPAVLLCLGRDEHNFYSTPVFIEPQSTKDCPENTIMYSGDTATRWYRTSKVFGFGSTEYGYGMGRRPGMLNHPDIVTGKKPIGTSCDCHKDIMRVGRFGKWTRGVLVHSAYEEVDNALHKLLN